MAGRAAAGVVGEEGGGRRTRGRRLAVAPLSPDLLWGLITKPGKGRRHRGRTSPRSTSDRSLAGAVVAASARLRDAAARHPRRAGAIFAEVACQTAQPRVAAGDRGA